MLIAPARHRLFFKNKKTDQHWYFRTPVAILIGWGRSTALDLETTLSRRERNLILFPSLPQSLTQPWVRFASSCSSQRREFSSDRRNAPSLRVTYVLSARTLKVALISSFIKKKKNIAIEQELLSSRVSLHFVTSHRIRCEIHLNKLEIYKLLHSINVHIATLSVVMR